MKRLHIYPLLFSLLFGSTATLVSAQTDTPAATPLTREQVKRERDEFVRTHRYDLTSDNWVLKESMEPPTGMKTRAEVKAERDEFLRTHRYDQTSDAWVTSETPRNMSTMTRAQVRDETRQFLRTHQWDDNSS
ncbi:MAG: DUF4148 domain-containing protein, partial [Rhodoferax sp.]|nr:DUF4148 domain-containing protein [Rhodoferax sp.]